MPPRLGSTICYGQELSRKSHQDSPVRFVTAKELARRSHQDSAVRFVTAKNWPERATKTRQYDLLRPNVEQKEPPRFGSTICYGQTWARKSHRDSAVRFVTAKRGPEKATKTRQYDLLRPNVEQKSHQDSAVRFVTAKSGPERATKTRQYDLLRPRVCQNMPPRLGSTICYGQTWDRKSHQDSAVRFVKAKSWPEKTTKTRQYDLLRPTVGQKKPPRLGSTICYCRQKEPPRLGSTICYCQTWARKSHQDSAVRFVTAKSWPERATKTPQYDLLRPNVGQKSHQDSAVRFVTAKRGPERATETRQYDLLRPRVGQKEPPRLGSTICYGYGQQKEPPRLGSTICYGQELSRKSHQDSAVRFVTAKSWPETATVRFVTAKSWQERATKTRHYDLLRLNVGQGAAVLFVTAKSWPERATETRQYDLLRPNVGQKEPPRLGSTICYGQTCARKNHQDSAVRFVTAKNWPERATKTRQYDL